MAKSSPSKNATSREDHKENGKTETNNTSINEENVPVIRQKSTLLLDDSNADAAAKQPQGLQGKEPLRTRTALFLLLLIFGASLASLLFVYYSFPHLDE